MLIGDDLPYRLGTLNKLSLESPTTGQSIECFMQAFQSDQNLFVVLGFVGW